jgi:hypothetical protein
MSVSEVTSLVPITPTELLPIVMALIFVSLIIRALLLERLRTLHHDVWVAMGMPTNFGSRKGSHELLRFTGFRGSFLKLDDQVLNAFVYIHRFAVVTMLVAFAGIILLALAGRK